MIAIARCVFFSKEKVKVVVAKAARPARWRACKTRMHYFWSVCCTIFNTWNAVELVDSCVVKGCRFFKKIFQAD